MHGFDVEKSRFTSPHFSTTMLFIHFMFFALTHAAPLELTTPKNLTALSRCTRSKDWQAYAFLVEDCFTAIQRLYIEEVLRKPDTIYEFVTTGTHQKTLHPKIRNARVFTVCDYHSIPFNCAVVGGGFLFNSILKNTPPPWLMKRKKRLVYTLHHYARLVRTQRVIARTWSCKLSPIRHG